MNFTAIDFETANQHRTSACQIGLVLVEDGEITKEFSSYIKPEPGYFISRFTSGIHGIDEDTVADAPDFPKVWGTIASFIEKAPLVVAHNVTFDSSVLKKCLEFHEINVQIPEYYCTYRKVARLLPELYDHRLSTVCEHFGIELNHHEALSDARAAALIAIKLGLE